MFQFLNFTGFLCVTFTIYKHLDRGAFFDTVAMTGFWFTGIMLILYLFHVVEKLHLIPWLKIEFAFCALWTFLYLIASALLANYGYIEPFAAASVSVEKFVLIS